MTEGQTTRSVESAVLSKMAKSKAMVKADAEGAALQRQREDIERARRELVQERARLEQLRATQATSTGKPAVPVKNGASRFFIRW